VKEYSEFTVLI